MTEPHAIDRDDVMAWLDGELPAARAAQVGAHVASCAACQALAGDLREVSARLQAWEIESPSMVSGLPRALEEALGRRPEVAPRGRWLPAWLELSWPQWGLAAASVAGVLLAVVVWNPLVDRAAPEPTFERAALDAPADAAALASPPAEPAAAPAAAPATGQQAPSRGGGRAAAAAAGEATLPAGRPGAQADRAVASAPPPATPPPLPPVPQVAPPPPPVAAQPPPPDLARADQRNTAGGVAGGVAGGIAAPSRRAEEFEALADTAGAPAEARAASLTLAVSDLGLARAALQGIATEAGGGVEPPPAPAQQAFRGGRGGGGADAPAAETMVLTIPVSALDDVMARIGGLGEVRNTADSAVDLAPALAKTSADLDAARQAEARAASAAAASELDQARRDATLAESIARETQARADVVRLTVRLVRGGAPTAR